MKKITRPTFVSRNIMSLRPYIENISRIYILNPVCSLHFVRNRHFKPNLQFKLTGSCTQFNALDFLINATNRSFSLLINIKVMKCPSTLKEAKTV